MPKVSVLIPVFNGAAHIERALHSVEIQTFRDFETIVLDDGSTDGSADIVRKFPWVTMLRQPNRGIGVTRQRLVDEASGEWISFLDHDDEFDPGKLANLLPLATDNVVLVHGRKNIIEGGHARKPNLWVPLGGADALDHLLPDNQISPSSVILKRIAVQEVGFEPAITLAEDWLAWFKLASRGEFRFVPKVVATIHKRSDSASRPTLEWYRAERHVLEACVLPHFDAWYPNLSVPDRARIRKLIRRKLGIIASLEAACLDACGDKKEARRIHLQALKDAPTKGALLRFLRHLTR